MQKKKSRARNTQNLKKSLTKQHGSEKGIENLEVTYLPVEDLKPHPRNTRLHPKKQIRQLAKSIKMFGFIISILIDPLKRIIAGHGRFEAAKLPGMKTVPTTCVKGLSESQIRAFMIADNKLTENATWDDPKLAIEIHELIESEFEIDVLGFEPPEIDILIESIDSSEDESSNEEYLDLPIDTPAVSRPDNLFHLGNHRLLCGDATQNESYDQLLRGEKAQMIITDPPFNVKIDGHARGLGQCRHKNFVMAAGEMSEAEFTGFLSGIFKQLIVHTIDGSIHFVFMDWRHLYEIQTAARSVYSELKNLIVWKKTNAGMGSFYRSQHELVFAFKNGTAPHINNFALGEYGRHRSNVWSYPGLNTFGPNRDEQLRSHPTPKPVPLIADAIRDCSVRDGIVLDPFTGSGPIFIASEKTGRKAYRMEFDPQYVDCAIQHWERFTGQEAIHAESGLSFKHLKEQRKNDQ